MPLPIKSFDVLVSDQVAAMNALATILLDFQVGSIFRAEVESNASLGLWLQAQASAVLAIARLQTSTGTEVDTFVGQFGLSRNPATFAIGNVTFSRFTSTVQSTINVGSLVLCSQTGVQYSVQPDTTNIYYNPDLNAYIVPIGISSISTPIKALTAGTVGNVLSNFVTTISSIIPGIDSVTNPDPIVSGTDKESDAALKIRFVDYLNGLSKATSQALAAAILGVPGVVRYKLKENENTDSTTHLGYFYAVIDDGTGNASSELISNVSVALNATRGLTIAFNVYAPNPFPISITAHVFTDGSTPDGTVQGAVITALETYISGQSFDAFIPYSEIPRTIYDVNTSISGNPYSPIINVSNYTLNGSTSDVVLTGINIATVGTLTVVMNA